jgi:hypothetical protein
MTLSEVVGGIMFDDVVLSYSGRVCSGGHQMDTY